MTIFCKGQEVQFLQKGMKGVRPFPHLDMNVAHSNYTRDQNNKTSRVALYLPKTFITPDHFWIVEPGHRMGEKNVRCYPAPGWEES
ncbi:hypothetical protein TNCV_625571 [Trichonephila clavipes]|nr:hypothetical protein TNCV_625571 [Trichonephila clavipes]